MLVTLFFHYLCTRMTNADILFRNYYRQLCIYALHYLHDVEQVEDVVQDCFLRLLEAADEP